MTKEEELQEIAIEDHASVDSVRDHYDRLSAFYRALWGEHIHHGYWEDGETPFAAQVKLVERLAARARVPPNASVLDVGCGLGGSSLWLARNLGCSVLGLSISPVQVALATERARAEKLDDRARFKVFDANRLGLLGETFDVVWVIECSEHLADKARFILDCARALKPGGALALCAWLKADPPASPGHARLVTEVCRGMLCPQLASARDYTGWMRACGLERIEAEDITRHVEGTWARCASIVGRPEIKLMLRATDERTRRFVESFAAIRRAYSVGAMAYGMFTAWKMEG
ncbi:MAG TPA: methyltransferase domain-containing protein [Pyrinomonadaceae bacterium]|nr:methyltransferase domain-containing protein [Pyrinomonadaceae bacterium]